jgi:DNA primase
VKQKEKTISQNVSETILTLRLLLLRQIIKKKQSSTTENKDIHHMDILSEIVDYNNLVNVLSVRLGRVISPYY